MFCDGSAVFRSVNDYNRSLLKITENLQRNFNRIEELKLRSINRNNPLCNLRFITMCEIQAQFDELILKTDVLEQY